MTRYVATCLHAHEVWQNRINLPAGMAVGQKKDGGRSFMKTYCFDIDGVICTNTWGDYEKATPRTTLIAQINALYDAGDSIVLFTARGTTTGIDWRALTEAQMKAWGVRYHILHFGKPQADLYIDDRGMSLEEWADHFRSLVPGKPAQD